MKTYYFHTEDGRPHNDEFGVDLPDRAAAQQEAVRMMADLMKDRPGNVLENGHWQVVVGDETRRQLFRLELRLVEE
ncbi:hypothetical protein P7B02_03735 [Caulobacter segnis]|uniref:DUF6894 family protein n=1 Tax=Caulobacter segnis TaxID=88688 RepID=UPI00240F2246|nr:hypothetical protein [Caulobacter segnis]MDG2520643.1 hypothetical protein [Caulobacter segnis]